MKVPVFVPTWSLPQKARRGGVWGRRSRFNNGSTFLYPRRGACARKVPTWGLKCRCPSARRRWRWALRFPNGGFGDSHPRARFGCALLVPKVALACPIGRGSPFKVVSSCRRCVLRASQRTSRETGATRAACAAQNRARRFPDQASLPRKCRARFSALRRASPPILCLCPQSGRGGARAPR